MCAGSMGRPIVAYVVIPDGSMGHWGGTRTKFLLRDQIPMVASDWLTVSRTKNDGQGCKTHVPRPPPRYFYPALSPLLGLLGLKTPAHPQAAGPERREPLLQASNIPLPFSPYQINRPDGRWCSGQICLLFSLFRFLLAFRERKPWVPSSGTTAGQVKPSSARVGEGSSTSRYRRRSEGYG
ncbi:uncharacterized protein LY79DRAFT_18572 [Colletotrichum navitas]|uniref:Uncharacterized protein n=1 Tax=Colletotrichum navitas TaxID=681940 RepID=A0AAD8VAI1_9PEZI|nr:uncharacterized protein LY79DRAFT_18572 [Colletotrichum navitas]KAK1600422.1 hypothetical protein LY79DRAFT_18572 [Colletotrichum navitas]